MPDATWVDAFLEEDDEDEVGYYDDDGDAIDAAVRGEGYIANFVIDQCVEEFEGGFFREPESFDRFYYLPQTEPPYEGPAPVLIDVLQADDPQTREAEAERKHVEFKRRWCKEHDLRYATVVADEAITREAVLRTLAEQIEGRPTLKQQAEKLEKAERKPAVQRPSEDDDS
jgi:hypothetical protein